MSERRMGVLVALEGQRQGGSRALGRGRSGESALGRLGLRAAGAR